MKILLDTNIFIKRENYQEIPEDLRTLLRILNNINAQIFIHPLSKKEIESDNDNQRKNIVLSKIQTYSTLTNPPILQHDIKFLQAIGTPKKQNDYVDFSLVYCVYRDAVNFLITEDKRLKSKATKIRLDHRVLNTVEALEVFLERFEEPSLIKPPAITEEYCYNLSIIDPFFDSFKNDYPEFDKWFQKICQEHRKCWVYKHPDGSLGALLVFKVEDETIGNNPILPKKRRFKICSIKAEYRGMKIGELFIKLSCEYAVEKNIDEIYLTVFSEKQPELIALVQEYGFEKTSNTKLGEELFLKRLFPEKSVTEIAPTLISSKYYPSFYDGQNVKKYIIPIRPEYHSRLFPKVSRQTLLPEHLGKFIIEGNTIKKAYLSHSKIKSVRPGDIVLFYQSKTTKTITTIGVVEEVHTRLLDPDKILQHVSKRTVYTFEEIKEFSKKPTLVILFKLHFHFEQPVKDSYLFDASILKGPPQTITEISGHEYNLIKRAGALNERYTFN